MRKILFILFAAIALFAAPVNSQAGFIIKKAAVATENAQTASTLPAAKLSKKEQRKEAVRALKKLIHDNGRPNGHHRRHSDSGWEGIVALVCGIVGLFTFYPAIPAIIFGAIGMGRGHEHRGMALAGFVLGVLTVVAVIVIFAILATTFGGF